MYSHDYRDSTLSKKTIAYYSGWNGIAIKDIEYGIEDYVICADNYFRGTPSVHRCKIHYESERAYFNLNGHRIPLDECIRTNL